VTATEGLPAAVAAAYVRLDAAYVAAYRAALDSTSDDPHVRYGLTSAYIEAQARRDGYLMGAIATAHALGALT